VRLEPSKSAIFDFKIDFKHPAIGKEHLKIKFGPEGNFNKKEYPPKSLKDHFRAFLPQGRIIQKSFPRSNKIP